MYNAKYATMAIDGGFMNSVGGIKPGAFSLRTLATPVQESPEWTHLEPPSPSF
jgi:hypothetical protein